MIAPPSQWTRQRREIIGRDVGEPIYNDRLKRFKFHLEKIKVTSAAEIAEFFWLQYHGHEYPKLTGVWGDPRTNSLIVVGPPEADQPIRDTIARWEGALLGIDLNKDETLEGQREQMQRRRRSMLREIANGKLEIIDAEAAGEKPDGERLTDLNRELESNTTELETIERKLKVINESIERLRDDNGAVVFEVRKGVTSNPLLLHVQPPIASNSPGSRKS